MVIKPNKTGRGNRRLKEPFFKMAKGFAQRRGRLILGSAAAAVVIAGAYAGYGYLMAAPWLQIEVITVDGDARLTRDEVIETAGIRKGENILALSTVKAVEGLKTNPWVEEARVWRTGLDAVAIEIKERVPLALVRFERPGFPQRLRIMDAGGVVFTEYSHEYALDLPVVSGGFGGWEGWEEREGAWTVPGVMELIGFLKAREGFSLGDVSEIRADKTFGLSVYTLREGVRLDVGVDGFEEKFKTFEKIVASRGQTLRGVVSIDLNNPGEAVVKFQTNMV
ncbi:MAG: FtsQ-type POTRA domain-containing protein [Deltaproteobacteria bacterium]|nr:FtsQ-type POTRA domain-containing protein [Deltaproteobacteria bacterium]